MEKSKEEEAECVIKDASFVVVSRVEEATGVNAKRPGVFVEVLGYKQRFKEVGL